MDQVGLLTCILVVLTRDQHVLLEERRRTPKKIDFHAPLMQCQHHVHFLVYRLGVLSAILQVPLLAEST
ncbi:hypothetical protein BDF19DRAFT_436155 [Syncephalis fuscata]|nr:hypothetical protein BDF19DRAFT_436155 [Syncephalis fuscata]